MIFFVGLTRVIIEQQTKDNQMYWNQMSNIEHILTIVSYVIAGGLCINMLIPSKK